MSSAIVSIIIPSFNRETLISETLNSVLKQTFFFWEALVVDDGSVDRTCEIVKSYVDRDPRIKLIVRDREPKNASVCRNIGIDHANGKYAIFLDSDDLLAPSCLEKRIKFMNSHPDLNFAVFQMAYFDKRGVNEYLRIVKKRDNYLYAYLKHDLPWQTTSPMWNLTFIRSKLKRYNEAYPRLQDPEFNTRALMEPSVKFEVLFESEVDAYCRLHWAKEFSIAILLSGFKLYIEEFLQRIKNRPDYKECKKELKYCYIEAVKGFYMYYRPNAHDEGIRLLTEIDNFAYRDKLIGGYSHFLTHLLITGYKFRLFNTTWGKYVLRTIIKFVKMS